MSSTTVVHVWHSHTVSGDRWLVLKAEYARRCAPRLGREHEASEARVLAQAAHDELMPPLDPHLPHN